MLRAAVTLLAAVALSGGSHPRLARAADPVKPFSGKDLAGWKLKDEKKGHWKALPGNPAVDPANAGRFSGEALKDDSPPALVNVKGAGSDVFTEATFGDCTITLDFLVPKGSNSGIYVMGEYEVQVLDSYGKPADKLTQGDLGALYSAAAPKVNAARKPGEWQTFEIVFRAPRFEGGKKVANAKFVKVTLNGTVLHENVEMKGPTPGGLTGKEAPAGPLMFQGDHGPVAFRNIVITPAK